MLGPGCSSKHKTCEHRLVSQPERSSTGASQDTRVPTVSCDSTSSAIHHEPHHSLLRTLDWVVHCLQALLGDAAIVPQHTPVVIMVACTGTHTAKPLVMLQTTSLFEGPTPALCKHAHTVCSIIRTHIQAMVCHNLVQPPSAPVLTAVQVSQVRLADCDILGCCVLVELLVPLLKERLITTLQHSTAHSAACHIRVKPWHKLHKHLNNGLQMMPTAEDRLSLQHTLLDATCHESAAALAGLPASPKVWARSSPVCVPP